MTTPNEIRTAIASCVATVAHHELEDEDLPTSLYTPDKITPPLAMVGLDSIDWAGIGENEPAFDVYHFVITLALSRNAIEGAQAGLDLYLARTGPCSIKAALDDDPLLGGLVDWSRGVRVENIGELVMNDVIYVGAQVLVDVRVPPE